MKKNVLIFILLFILHSIIGFAKITNNKISLNKQIKNEIKFTENKGQIVDMTGQPVPFVLYKVEVPGMSMYITEKGLTYMPFSMEEEEEYELKGKHKIETKEKIEIKYSRIDMELKDATIKRENIITEEKSVDEKRYFLAHCPKGITDVHSYKKVIIKNIYPNIDWVLYNSTEKGFKYDFIVHPGANPQNIKLLYRTKNKPNINSEGAIEIKTKQGKIIENAPYSYLNNSNTEIKSAFTKITQMPCTPTGVDRGYETEIGFNVQSFDLSQNDVLIIDPQLTWSTYIGSNSIDGIMCSAVDNSGNFYVAGYTADNGYPTQAWGTAYFDNTINNPVGYGDVFLSKFSNAGVLLWSTYYGGDNSEEAHSMTIDQSGNIYVVGSTSSTNLPAQSFGAAYYDNSFNSTLSFNSDIFIVRFSATGNLDWATYYGGSERDDARCVTTDAIGNVYITGFSQSFNFPLLNLGGAYFYNTSIFGTILLKFSPTGVLTWATVFQSSNFSTSYGESVVVDNLNNLYLLGETTGNLVTVNPGSGAYFDNTAGNNDAFIAKFNSAGALTWSTYLGGNNNVEYIYSARVDASNNLVVLGSTKSTDFPTQSNGSAYFDNTFAGGPNGGDMFISKFTSAGALTWSTYFGGSQDEMLGGGAGDTRQQLAIDKCDNIYAVFSTTSSDITTLTNSCAPFYKNALQNQDNFITKFTNAGALEWATYFGGIGTDLRTQIIIDQSNNIFLSGEWNLGGGASDATYTFVNPGGGSYFQNTNGGSDDSFMMKIEQDLITNTKSTTNPSSCGLSDGTATVTVTSCSSPTYNYTWSNGVSTLNSISNTNTISNLSSGTYSVTVNFNCGTFIETFTIAGSVSTYSLTPSSTAATCGQNNGSATATPSIAGTYNYTWSSGASGQTSPTAINLAAGNYTVTVSNGSGCNTTTSVTVPSIGGATISSITKNDANCFGSNGNATVNISSGVSGIYTYSWSNGVSTITTATSNNQLLTSNSYTVTVIDGACSTTTVVSITEPSAITFGTPTTNNASCGISNGSASVSASGGTGTLNYSWSATETSASISNKPAGVYIVTVTDFNSCTNTLTISIGSNGGANISSVTKNDANCFGSNGNAIVNISGGVSGNYTYSWGNGISTITNATSNSQLLTANSYTVTVIDGACSTTTVISISEPSAITFGTPTINNTTCGISNGNASVTATGGTGALNYSWSATETTATINNKTSGSYIVTVTDINSCSATLAVNIGSIGGATISSAIKNDASCFGGNGNATVNISSGVSGNYTYSWSNGISNITTATSNSQLLTANSYTVTVMDGACTTTTIVNVTEPSAISFATPSINNASCGISNGGATVTATGGTGTLNYSWSATELTAAISNKTSGNYIVTVTDINSCTATLAVNIGSNGGATISSAIKNDASCFGGNGNATVNISGGVSGNYTYSWSNGASTVTTSISNQELLTANSYTITVIDGACSTTTVVNITQPAALVIGINKTNASCAINNGSITAAVSNGTANYTFVWSAILGYANTSISTGVNIINNLIADAYSLVVTDNNNCTAATTVTIINSGNPNANASATAYEIEEGASTLLTASGGISYLWTPPTALSCTTCPNPTANPSNTTTYTLVIRDAFGCIDSTDITIKVSKSCTDEKDVFIANIFSPNGDGKNDVVKIEGNGLTNIYWSIFDRWGNLVFESRNQDNGWDGTVNGNIANTGTYVYYLKATCKKTLREIILKGNISLVR